ncbi:MAG: hypothetical protein ACREQL_13125 [Candidatus Binatia bacterium]
MTRKSLLAIGLAAAATVLPTVGAIGGDVNIGISIGVPAPPPRLVVASPPPVVVVPGTPVSYVPSASFNLFVFEGRYFSLHNGVWFHAAVHDGPWTVVATERVPQPLLAVPVTYYKIPPGHAKKMGGPSGHGCPPGLAKQGRC